MKYKLLLVSSAMLGGCFVDKKDDPQPTEKVIKLNTVEEISKYFDIEEIKGLIDNYEGFGLVDASSEIDLSQIPKSENFPVNVGTSKAQFNLENSIVYGYEGYLDVDGYTEQCNAALDAENKVLYKEAQFSLELDEGINSRTFILPNTISIVDFTASITTDFNPIPEGYTWNVSFSVAKPLAEIEEAYIDYGNVKGIFSIQDGELSTSPYYSLVEGELEMVGAFTPRFPPRYPVPPKTEEYRFDPNHDSCSNPNPSTTYTSMSAACSALGNKAKTECKCIEILNHPEWPNRQEVESCAKLRNNYNRIERFKNMGHYVEPQGSSRITTQPAAIDCKAMFRSLAGSYGIEDWIISFPSALAWNGNIRSGANDCRNEDIEPCNNYCVDRWKEYPWSNYEDAILVACKDAPIFRSVEAAQQRNTAAEKMANQCRTGSEMCKNLGRAIEDLIDKDLTLKELQGHIESKRAAVDKSREASLSYLIPFDDKYFSILETIERYVNDVENGFDSLKKAQKDHTADWNLGMEKLTGKVMPSGFQSLEELKATMGDYKALLIEMNELARPELSKLSCTWDGKGRFRKILELKVESTNTTKSPIPVTSDLRNIAPVETK